MELNSNVKTIEFFEAFCKELVKEGAAQDITATADVDDAPPKGFEAHKYQIFVKNPEDVLDIDPLRVNVRFWYLKKVRVKTDMGYKEIDPDKGTLKISYKGAMAIMHSATVLSKLEKLNIKMDGKLTADILENIIKNELKVKETVEIEEE